MTGEPDSLEAIIAGAAKGGWDWFDGLDPRIRQLVEVREADNNARAKRIAQAWAKFAATPAGAEALDAMFEKTHRRVTFFTQLGLPMDQTAMWGAFREGQKSLAQEIARLIAIGRGDRPPKTRETP